MTMDANRAQTSENGYTKIAIAAIALMAIVELGSTQGGIFSGLAGVDIQSIWLKLGIYAA